MSMYKAQRLLAEAMRSKRKQLEQQQQDASADGLSVADKKHRNHQHHRSHHHNPHSQQHQNQKQLAHHSLGGIGRQPLRQYSNGQQQQEQHNRRQLCSKKRSDAGATSRHGSSTTLESVKDASELETADANDVAESAAKVQQQQKEQQPKPCLDRAAKLPVGLLDVDQRGHCTMVSAYAKDIFVYLAERELHYALPADFLAGHAEVTERSRAVLVDWLLQLSSRLELQADTYHLSVRLLDHYLAIERSVAKRHLQLLGATALWLASKFEEVYCISISDLLHVCSGACNRRDLLAMEVRLISTLDFHLLPPLPITFLRRLSKVAGVDNRLHYAAKYMLELATLCARLAWRPASQLAAAAMRVALGSGGRDWSDLLAFYSGYELEELRPVAADLARACVRAAAAGSADFGVTTGGTSSAKHQRFVYQKYRSVKCFAVAGCSQLRPDSEYLAGLIAQDC